MNLQSFDVNILKEINESYPGVETDYLVYTEGIQKNLALLDFQPEIYSPHYGFVKDTAFVDSIKSMKMKLIPWTVNEVKTIDKMMELLPIIPNGLLKLKPGT